jgi:cytochrome c1
MVKKSLILAIALLLVVTALAFAAVNTYQVTGPVLAVTADSITVQKGKDKWELARDKETKVKGDLKVGSKVTIEYRMIATSIDVKEEKAPAKKK